MADCIFCKIANKEIGSLIYEDEFVAAFNDLSPKAPIHILVIPKVHIERISEVNEQNIDIVGKMVLVANKIAAEHGINQSGYRLIMNCNEDAGQSVWHIHLHILGGRDLGGLIPQNN